MRYASIEQLIQFETKISELWEEGLLPYLLHLSGGNEEYLVNLFASEVKEGDWVFSTHRNHYHALLAGISASKLEALIMAGKSMFVFDKERRFFTSSVLGGTCCIAAGVAWALKEGHGLPLTFVIEDNNRSVDSSIRDRLPNEFRVSWPSCVRRNTYVPTFPHAGNGTKKKILFRTTSGA
jgi:hypothetical protein